LIATTTTRRRSTVENTRPMQPKTSKRGTVPETTGPPDSPSSRAETIPRAAPTNATMTRSTSLGEFVPAE